MCPESRQHKKIKEIILEKMLELYGTGLKEFPDSGNINDIYVVTGTGLTIFVENVWSSDKNNFYRDLNILHNSDAAIKLFIVNQAILDDEHLVREYEKARISENKKGILLSPLINGTKILNDKDFVNIKFPQIVSNLVSVQQSNVKSKKKPNVTTKHSRRILLTRPDYQGLDQGAPNNLMINLLLHGQQKLETKYLLQHFESGYFKELCTPLMEYKTIMEKYDRLKGFHLGFEKTSGYKEISDADLQILSDNQEKFLTKLNELIFAVENGAPLEGSCDFCKEKAIQKPF
jgi:hypothetical protein